jgi:hypothetical protein
MGARVLACDDFTRTILPWIIFFGVERPAETAFIRLRYTQLPSVAESLYADRKGNDV